MTTEGCSAAALLQNSELARHQGNHRLGAALAERASQLALESGSRSDRAKAEGLLALHLVRLGNFEAAIRAGECAISLEGGGGDPAVLSQHHCTLAIAHMEANLWQHALQHAAAAFDAALASGDLRAECWALNRLGIAYEGSGDTDRGIDFLRRALSIAERLAGVEEVFAALNNLANASLNAVTKGRAGGHDVDAYAAQALAASNEALRVARSESNPHRETVSGLNHASALRQAGRIAEATQALASAEALAIEHGYAEKLLEIALERSCANAAKGDLTAAIAELEVVVQRAVESSNAGKERVARQRLAELLKRTGVFEAALAHYERFHALDIEDRARQADLQSRILINRLELDQARHASERLRLEAEMQRLRADELDRAAHEDPLTGLLNRRSVNARLPMLMARAAEHGRPMSAALLDLDHFKRVNDTYGHAIGDRVLSELAALLTKTARISDFVARMGGEEFLVLFVDTALEPAQAACERLCDIVRAHPWESIAPGLAITVSIGLSAYAGQPDGFESWMARADAALYAAKHAGRNRVTTS